MINGWVLLLFFVFGAYGYVSAKNKDLKKYKKELKSIIRKDISTLILLAILCNTPLYTSHCTKLTHTISWHYDFINNRIPLRIVTVDGVRVSCWCGKDPVFIFISYGHLECYCLLHAHDIFY